jgi:formylglycine-generating enzyme required for sulfatase activity
MNDRLDGAVGVQDNEPGVPPAPGMAWIPGGTFRMGSDHHYPEEAPAHRVTVNGFWMDVHALSNAEFKRFVDATGYVTLAERPANPDDLSGRQAGAADAFFGDVQEGVRPGRPAQSL